MIKDKLKSRTGLSLRSEPARKKADFQTFMKQTSSSRNLSSLSTFIVNRKNRRIILTHKMRSMSGVLACSQKD